MKKATIIILATLFTITAYAQENTYTTDPSEQTTFENRNAICVGYQIGGITLIGLDYEIRLHDIVGIHFGGGLSGYTAGIKLHTNPSKNSSFFNLSFKDGGFGQYQTAGVEYGGKWVFNKEKNDFGLIFQIGLSSITKITDEFKEILYPTVDTPSYTLSFGIGFGW